MLMDSIAGCETRTLLEWLVADICKASRSNRTSVIVLMPTWSMLSVREVANNSGHFSEISDV